MFIPSARVWKEMQFEPCGFWPVPINSGDEFAFLAKVPTHVIKAAYRGCPISLTISAAATSDGTVLSTVLEISDDPASPMGFAGVHRHPEEQLALDRIMEADDCLFVFFDELSRPVFRATCSLDHSARDSAHALLEKTSDWYAGAWTDRLGEVLDELQTIVDPTRNATQVFSPELVRVPLTLSAYQTSHITAVGEQEVRAFRLEDTDEGYVLEQSTWHLLEHLFGRTIFHSPQIPDGESTRELTDIFAFCGVGLCFFETKAMAVLSTAPDRSTERRARNIEKQIGKGLDQLRGAMRRLEKGLPLWSKAGTPIVVPSTAGPFRHGIVMVSELLPALDWKTITARLLSLSSDTTMLHVLDLQELRLLVGVSKDNPVLFLANLLYRHERMREQNNALMRMKLDGPPLP